MTDERSEQYREELETREQLILKMNRIDRQDRRLSARLAFAKSVLEDHSVEYWLTRAATHAGDSWVWWLIAYGLWRQHRPKPYVLGIERVKNPGWYVTPGRGRVVGWMSAMLTTTVLVMLLKQTIQRPRPGSGNMLYGSGPDAFSFPSGHAARMGVVAVWGSLYGTPVGWIVGVLAVVVSWTRVRLGIHYVGDVVGGLLVGGFLGLVARLWRRTLYSK